MTAPNRLGKYEITEVLGKGAMGVVYKGFDPGIRRTVAIKTIRRDLIEGERPVAELLARFRNEAQAAGKLAHPGIVAVYDYGEEAAVAYIAMEYVEGNSLREYFSSGTRFAERDAVSIMSQLLEALGHAHERRVWHRDVKPANLIVMMNGQVKVADFGIARIEASDLTQTGVVMGSPGYMAPEQYAAAAIDHRADLFAAGVVFYELVTGTRPFVGTMEQISYAICHTDALRPSLADPGKGWDRYDPIVSKALAKRPEDRFQTAEEFRAAILTVHAVPPAPTISEETIITQVLRPAAAVDLSSPSRPVQGFAPRLAAAPAAPASSSRGWAIGSGVAAGVALIVAAFAAWQAGWFVPTRSGAGVEAQLAKARAEADEATRRAQTEAAAAVEARRQLELERAEEAKAAEARAEATEAERRAQKGAAVSAAAKRQLESQRAAQAKANAEARAARARADAEAARRKQDAQLAVASKNRESSPKPAAPAQEEAPPSQSLPRWLWSSAPPAGSAQEKAPPVAATARPAATASRYDGAWTVTRSCDAFEEFPAQVQNWPFTVKGGEFVVERGKAGQPGYHAARGRPGEDGSLVLTGTGIASTQRSLGKSYPVFFEGRLNGERFVLKGRLGERACTLVLARG